MSARMVKVQAEEKGTYSIYLNRARQFYEVMKFAGTTGKWAAVGLNAVHCAISINDALTVRFLEKRSVGDDHRSAADLLLQVPVEGVCDQGANYKRILAKKNAVAYEGRDFRQNEALEILKQAERFYQWALNSLPAE